MKRPKSDLKFIFLIFEIELENKPGQETTAGSIQRKKAAIKLETIENVDVF